MYSFVKGFLIIAISFGIVYVSLEVLRGILKLIICYSKVNCVLESNLVVVISFILKIAFTYLLYKKIRNGGTFAKIVLILGTFLIFYFIYKEYLIYFFNKPYLP